MTTELVAAVVTCIAAATCGFLQALRLRALHHGDFLLRQAVQLVDKLIYLVVGGGYFLCQ